MRTPEPIRSAMNGKNYNTETARSYLLGSLPEQESLRYDELSIVDDGFDEFLRNVENDLVDSYVNGSLDAITSKKFESFYLTTPIRRRKVAFARAFYQYTDRDPTIEPSGVKASEIGFWEKLRLALRPATLAFGSVALLCLIGAIWFIRDTNVPHSVDVAVTEPQNAAANIAEPENSPAEPATSPGTFSPPVDLPRPDKSSENRREIKKVQPPEPPPSPVVASFVLTPPLRGAGETKGLKIRPNIERATFRLELEPTDYDAYKVELVDQTNKVVWTAGDKRPKGDRTRSISVSISAPTLKPQIYVFRVFGVAPDGATENVGDYTFRIMR